MLIRPRRADPGLDHFIIGGKRGVGAEKPTSVEAPLFLDLSGTKASEDAAAEGPPIRRSAEESARAASGNPAGFFMAHPLIKRILEASSARTPSPERTGARYQRGRRFRPAEVSKIEMPDPMKGEGGFEKRGIVSRLFHSVLKFLNPKIEFKGESSELGSISFFLAPLPMIGILSVFFMKGGKPGTPGSIEARYGVTTMKVSKKGKSKHILFLDGSGKVVGHFKPASRIGDQYMSEVFAYVLAKRLGLDNVPETFIVDHPQLGVGSFQVHVEARPSFSWIRSPLKTVNQTERQKALIFDILVGHQDRDSSNVLIQDERLILLDHEDTAISNKRPLSTIFAPEYKTELKKPMTEDAADFFHAIDIDEVTRDMNNWIQGLPTKHRVIPDYKVAGIKRRYEKLRSTWAKGIRAKYKDLIQY